MYQFIQNTECVTSAKKLDIEFLFCPTLRAECTCYVTDSQSRYIFSRLYECYISAQKENLAEEECYQC